MVHSEGKKFPFWKKDLISLDSSSFFKGSLDFSPILNFLMLCKDKMFKTLRQSSQFSANDECLAQWLVMYLYIFIVASREFSDLSARV